MRSLQLCAVPAYHYRGRRRPCCNILELQMLTLEERKNPFEILIFNDVF